MLVFTNFLTLILLFTSILVVTSTSTVYSVLWLVATFIITSIYLSLFNLGFPALLYIIVYVGAIAILFLFIVQLLDLTNEVRQENSSFNFVTLFLTSFLFGFIFMVKESLNWSFFEDLDFFLLSTNSGQDLFWEKGVALQVESLAQWLYGPGIILLIIVGIILLIAMIAPISLCSNLD